MSSSRWIAAAFAWVAMLALGLFAATAGGRGRQPGRGNNRDWYRVAVETVVTFIVQWSGSQPPVEEQKDPLAMKCLNDCLDTFAEYADEETLRLLPGHAYFLDQNPSADGRAARIRARLEHELLPLLRDYLSERLCGAADREIAALVDRIEARVAAAIQGQ